MHRSNDQTTPGRVEVWAFYIGLLLLTLLGLKLRTTTLGDSLWLDELVTAWTVDGSLGQLIERATVGHVSPVYFLLPWASRLVFGFSEWSLRLPSVVAGVAAIPLTGWMTWRWARSGAAALLATALVTMDENQLFFSQEARVYAVLQLVALAQVACLARLTREGEHHWFAATAGLSVLMFYLHYTSILLLAAELVWLLGCACWRRPRGLTRRLSWLAVVSTLTLPGLFHLLTTGGRRDAWWAFIDPPDLGQLVWLFAWPAYLLPALGVLLLGFGMRRLLPKARWFDSAAPSEIWWLAVCWMTLPVFVAWAMTATEVAPLWLRRFLFTSAVAPMVLAGLCVGTLRQRAVQALLAAVCLYYAVEKLGPPQLLDPRVEVASHTEEDWPSAVAQINEYRENQGWPVLVRSGLIEANQLPNPTDPLVREMCLAPLNSLYQVNQPKRKLIPLRSTQPGNLSQGDLAILANAEGFWVIGRGNRATQLATERELRKTLAAAGCRTEVMQFDTTGKVWISLLVNLEKQP